VIPLGKPSDFQYEMQFSLQEIQLLRSYFSDPQWAEGQKAFDQNIETRFLTSVRGQSSCVPTEQPSPPAAQIRIP
jgi:hypothetical protein